MAGLYDHYQRKDLTKDEEAAALALVENPKFREAVRQNFTALVMRGVIMRACIDRTGPTVVAHNYLGPEQCGEFLHHLKAMLLWNSNAADMWYGFLEQLRLHMPKMCPSHVDSLAKLAEFYSRLDECDSQ